MTRIMNSYKSERDTILNFNNDVFGCETIRAVTICAKCDAEELDTLRQVRIHTRHPAKSVICHCGDSLDFVATVGQGALALSRSLVDGRQSIVGVLMPGDFFGYPCNQDSQFDITTLTDVTLCRFRAQEFEHLMDSSPNLCRRLLEVTSCQLTDARNWIHVVGCKTAKEKIASLVTMLIARGRRMGQIELKESGTMIWLPFSRMTIADLLGLTVETVSRSFSELRKDGVISFDGPRLIRVRSFSNLVSETGEFGEFDDPGGINVSS